MPLKKFLQFIRLVNWNLEKGGIDWNLYSDKGQFICFIKIAHGKKTKEEVVAYSVQKTEKAFKERRLTWPPRKK